MKQGRKPTLMQRNFIESKRLDSDNWLVTKDTPSLMEMVHRESKKIRKYNK